MSGLLWFWVAVLGLALSAVFSALFHSLRDVARTALEELAHERARPVASRRIERILEDVDGHSTAIALPRILCNLITVVAAVFWVTSLRATTAPTWVEVAIGVAGSALAIWVFGLLLPHSVAKHAAERTVYAWSLLIRACYVVISPFQRIVGFFDEVVRRLAGVNVTTEAEALEAELMSVVEEAQQGGQFDEFERDMIGSVVRFRSTTVEQIMTPRTEIEALELTNNLGEVISFIRHSGHSRIPVYQGDLDHVAGIFYVKDLMRWLASDGSRGSGRPFELKGILRPAIFVPESKTIRELLSELILKQVHVALVADEYGGTSGLVTIEDIVEEVFGEIRDEYETPDDDVAEIVVSTAGRVAEIDGRAYIHDANEKLAAVGVELPEAEEYDTVGGLVITLLGHIPRPGESLRIGSAHIRVLEAEPTRVNRVRLEVLAPEQDDHARETSPGRRGEAVPTD